MHAPVPAGPGGARRAALQPPFAVEALREPFFMTARELYHAGQLAAAIQALGVELRDNPTDTRRRTFLFELLCFAGEYDRAQKHLDVLAGQGPDSATGALLYRAALNADRMRSDLFTKRDYPEVHESDVPV